MAGNPNFNTLLAETLRHHIPKMEDNIFKDTPFMSWLKRSDHIRKVSGGTEIIQPLEYAMNSTAKSYSGWDTLDVTPQEEATAAQFPWRQFAVSVVGSGLETEIQNNGPEAIINLIKTKVSNAQKSTSELLNSMLFGDGTGNGGKDWYGLGLLVHDETGTATVAGIDCTTAANSWWRSSRLDGATNVDAAKWTTAFNNASNGGTDHPDFAITTQSVFEEYEAGLATNLRYLSTDTADARFSTLEFKGIRVYFDYYCPAETTYFLNSAYLYLTVHSSRWLQPTGWKEAPDKDAKFMQLLSAGNLTVSNRKRHSLVYNQQ